MNPEPAVASAASAETLAAPSMKAAVVLTTVTLVTDKPKPPFPAKATCPAKATESPSFNALTRTSSAASMVDCPSMAAVTLLLRTLMEIEPPRAYDLPPAAPIVSDLIPPACVAVTSTSLPAVTIDESILAVMSLAM